MLASSAAAADLASFGAVGDGTHDDTDAIQRAVDSGQGAIRFAKATYRITRPIQIQLDKLGYTSLHGDGVSRVVMAGPGPAFRFVGTHFKSADPGGFSEQVWQNERMPLVDGLAIVGDHPEADGIAAIGTMQLTIRSTHIRHVRHAVHLLENNRNVNIADCHFYENYGIGVFYDQVNLHQSNITGCHISYNRQGGIVSRGGNVRNIHITGCDLESNMHSDTEPTANVLIDCRNSRYGTAEVAITGCTIQHNHTSPDSANVRIIGQSDPAPDGRPVREGNVTITGNIFSDVQTNVHLRECRGVVVMGNTFWQGYLHNLLIESCSNIVLGPNNLDRNPRYDYGDSRDARNAVVIRDSEDCTITGLHVTQVQKSSAGLLIENCRRINLSGCTILDCDGPELLLKNVRDSRVASCLLRDDTGRDTGDPVRVEGGENVHLSP